MLKLAVPVALVAGTLLLTIVARGLPPTGNAGPLATATATDGALTSIPATPSPSPTTPAADPARARVVVALDPGHGGRELGAVVEGIVERDSNRDIGHRVRDLLRERGVDVIITREAISRGGIDAAQPDDATATFLDLQARVAAVNAAQANVLVSIHSNFWLSADSRGLEAYFNAQRPFAEQNRRLAELLLVNIEASLRSTGVAVAQRGLFEDTEFADASGRRTPFFILGPERDVTRNELTERGIAPSAVGLRTGEESLRTAATQMPGALLELLYVSNPSDAALLQDVAAREAIAQGIADGIVQFLGVPR